MRLQVFEDQPRWVAVTESCGFRGRKHRKRAISMIMRQMQPAGSARQGGLAAWAFSQAVPALLRKAAGRVLVWVWKDDPELVVVVASVQQATPQMRVARAMRPMEEDDTENFGHPTLGMGERLVLNSPSSTKPPTVQYTFDLTTHIVEVQAIAGDRERFGTVLGELDALVRDMRVAQDLTAGEGGNTLQLPPA